MENYLEEIKKYHIEFSSVINEAETPSKKPEDPPIEKPIDTPTEEPDPATGTEGGDEFGASDDTGFAGGGFGEEEEETLTISELGRVYTLKKLYYKMLALQHMLNENSDPKLLKLKKMINDSLDLFTLVIDNIKTYKDDIDKIIIKYYRLLERIIQLLNIYFKNKKEHSKEKDSNKESISDNDIEGENQQIKPAINSPQEII